MSENRKTNPKGKQVCVVVGATSLMLVALAHQSLRRPRQLPAAETGGQG